MKALSFVLIPALSLTAAAQTERQDAPGRQDRDARGIMSVEDASPFVHKVGDVLGASIVNQNGEELGEVDDLILRAKTGQIEYAVLSVGGFLGIGDDLFVVPWKVVQVQRDPEGEGMTFTLPVDRSQLEAAVHFPKDRWPQNIDESWEREVHQAFGTEPRDLSERMEHGLRRAGEEIERGVRRAGEEIDEEIDLDDDQDRRTGMDRPQGGMQHPPASNAARNVLLRVSEIDDLDVVGSTNEEIGDVEEIAFDAQNGRVTYLVLGVGGFLGMGEKQVAIPWDMAHATRNAEGDIRLTVPVTKERLANAPEFDGDNWDQMSEQAYSRDVYAFYDCHPYWTRTAEASAPRKESGQMDEKKKREHEREEGGR